MFGSLAVKAVLLSTSEVNPPCHSPGVNGGRSLQCQTTYDVTLTLWSLGVPVALF
jgi:hypothetical protein